MKQIERYIFARIAKLTFWSIVSITLLSMTTQILIRVDILTTSSNAIMTFIKLAIALIPEVLLVIAPFALLLGIGRILVQMNDDSELVVLEAAGASTISLAKPILLFSVCVGILMLFTANIVGPRARIELHKTIADAKADILSLAVASGSFRRIEDGLYIHIAEALPGGAMGGVFLSDQRDEDVQLIYYAKTGTIEKTESGDLLLMQDGEIHRAQQGGQKVSIVQFQSYALDLSLFIPATVNGTQRPDELFFSQLLNPDTESSVYKQSKPFLTVELHTRLVTWLYPICFGVVMVVFLAKARSHRQENMGRICAAVVTCLVVRIVGGAFLEESKSHAWAVFAAYATPIGTSVFFMAYVVTGRTIVMPKMLALLFDKTQSKIARLRTSGISEHPPAGTAQP